ncbi:MAG: TetR/AcrR family transcriptional regulator [Myxococcales bacterium]|nr:TetR/AcrR family transcriptional regulator [Myxococcales bacterium]
MMRAIPTTNPRRRPRQARAQATVDAIVKATAQVLVGLGYDRASTNRIAQTAGVSIGSLYQYFPSKEALVANLVESHREQMDQVLRERLAGPRPGGLEARARRLTAALVAAYRVDPELHHVLCQEVPKVGKLCEVYGFEQRLASLCREYLFSSSETRPVDVERATFLLVNSVPSVIRAHIQADTEGAHDEGLIEEITELMVRYLSA